MSSKRKVLFHLLSILLAVAVFFFLGREFVKNWHQIKDFKFQFNVPVLILASTIYAAAFLPLSAGWYLILQYVRNPLPFFETILCFCITQPAKYIPGKIWLAVTRMKFCKKHNVPNSITLLTTGIEGSVEIIATSYIALVALGVSGTLGKFSYWGILAATLFGLVILYPPIFYACINLYLKIVKRDPLHKNQRVSFFKLLLLQIIYIIGMFLLNVSQIIFLQSFAPVDIKYFPLLIGVNAFSYAAGILAPFTPSGLGVRESIWYIALKTSFTPSAAIVFAFASRLWTIIIEALLLFLSTPFLWLRHRFHKKSVL